MKHEKSCGAVIMRKTADNNTEILLVQMKNGGHYSFPKGHVEQGESEYMTASREIMEETALEVNFLDGFRACTEYSPSEGITKEVVYFAAVASSRPPVRQEAEIDDIGWYKESDAMQLVTYENDKKILRDAIEFFSGRDN